jgi:protein-tyrosine phosphatase
MFIHEALYEYCLYGFTDIELTNLVAHIKYLRERSSVNSQGMAAHAGSQKTRLQVEYDKLANAFVQNAQAIQAFTHENRPKNRKAEMVCYDENRVRLSTLNGSSYINATKIKGYELPNEIIVTQDPMSNTRFEFWKMVVEYECAVIVALNKDFQLVCFFIFDY